MDNNLENSNLKWAEDCASFFDKNNISNATVYLSGENKYLNRYFGPMNYMLHQRGVTVVEVDASQIEKIVPSGGNFIYIKNAVSGSLEKELRGCAVIDSVRISPADVYILKRK